MSFKTPVNFSQEDALVLLHLDASVSPIPTTHIETHADTHAHTNTHRETHTPRTFSNRLLIFHLCSERLLPSTVHS